MFASGSGDKAVSLWDIRTNQCVQTFYGHNNAVNSVKFNLTVSEELLSEAKHLLLFREIN